MSKPDWLILQGDCKTILHTYDDRKFDLTFLDPPFNQGKDYNIHNDKMATADYWAWMTDICRMVYEKSSNGSAIYFMQREKNVQHVLNALESSGWTFQNLIIWKKKTSAIPSDIRYGKHFQIIAFYTKGKRPKVFNKLRIDPPLLETERYRRPNGVYITDVWDDIRELTSGYFAGDEALRSDNGQRIHKQQTPIALLTRIILSSSNIDDLIFDPFAGTGTTLVASKLLGRHSLGIELDTKNVTVIKDRIRVERSSDDLSKYRRYYCFTESLDKIWPEVSHELESSQSKRKLPDSPSRTLFD